MENAELYRTDTSEYICPKCSRKFNSKMSLSVHFGYCTGKTKSWCKGLNKDNNETLKRVSEKMKKYMKSIDASKIVKDSIKKDEERYKNACRKGGRHSAFKQNKRSKNEIHFYELCLKLLGESVVFNNYPIFDGWDADVVITDKKIAVLWNGIWHYKQISKKQSLKQVQIRDEYKLRKIKEYEYTAYIIKDLGRENPDFVKSEFIKFVQTFYPEMVDIAEKIATEHRYIINEDIRRSRSKYLELKKENENGSEEKEDEQEKQEKFRKNMVIYRARRINLIRRIKKSGIDFSKLGWVGRVAEILNIQHQKVHFWMKKNMPCFYDSMCFKRQPIGAPKKRVLSGKGLRRWKNILLIHKIRTANIDFSKPDFKEKINAICGWPLGYVWMQYNMPKFCIEHGINPRRRRNANKE